MAREWFKPWGWAYRPASWQALAVLLVAGGLGAEMVAAAGSRSQSAGDWLAGVVPAVVACLAIVNWVASKTSPEASRPRRRRLRDMDSPGWDG